MNNNCKHGRPSWADARLRKDKVCGGCVYRDVAHDWCKILATQAIKNAPGCRIYSPKRRSKNSIGRGA